MRLPIVVQLLHSVKALPDSSDKLGLVSVTFQTKRRQTGLASAKKTAGKINCVTGVRVQNYGNRLSTGSNTSINVFSNCYFFE